MTSVFQKFGGIRPMAAKLGDVPPSTIKSWHTKRQIPAWRHASILSAAEKLGIALTLPELQDIPADSEAADDDTLPAADSAVTRNGEAEFRT